MAMTLRVVVPPHPLIGHWLTVLRFRDTPPALYSTALQEIGRWLSYEALRDWLPHRRESVLTDQGETEGTVVERDVPLLAMPVLPAGLELWQGARSVLPDAALCLEGVPAAIESRAGVIVFKDQISDGSSTLALLENWSTAGSTDVVCAWSLPSALAQVSSASVRPFLISPCTRPPSTLI